MQNYTNIDEYIDNWPQEIQEKLNALRKLIKECAPDAQEKISYGIPTYTYHGNLIHFGAAKTHIGLYPGSGPVAQFADQLKNYKTSKGTIQLPIDKPLPTDLIKQIVAACSDRNLAKKNK